jgi:hypothetical protein
MSEPNPYQTPRESPPSEPVVPPESRLGPLILPVLGGMGLGTVLLAPFVRGPGDPTGHILGCVFGGFVGLGVGIYLLATRPR